jgi:hypothetical protein
MSPIRRSQSCSCSCSTTQRSGTRTRLGVTAKSKSRSTRRAQRRGSRPSTRIRVRVPTCGLSTSTISSMPERNAIYPGCLHTDRSGVELCRLLEATLGMAVGKAPREVNALLVRRRLAGRIVEQRIHVLQIYPRYTQSNRRKLSARAS